MLSTAGSSLDTAAGLSSWGRSLLQLSEAEGEAEIQAADPRPLGLSGSPLCLVLRLARTSAATQVAEQQAVQANDQKTE